MAINPVGSFNSTPGGSAVFFCRHQLMITSASIQWFVNGTRLEEVQGLRNVTARGRTLIFENIPLAYNMTRIWCAITIKNETNNATSDSLLLLQGYTNKLMCVY